MTCATCGLSRLRKVNVLLSSLHPSAKSKCGSVWQRSYLTLIMMYRHGGDGAPALMHNAWPTQRFLHVLQICLIQACGWIRHVSGSIGHLGLNLWFLNPDLQVGIQFLCSLKVQITQALPYHHYWRQTVWTCSWQLSDILCYSNTVGWRLAQHVDFHDQGRSMYYYHHPILPPNPNVSLYDRGPI